MQIAHNPRVVRICGKCGLPDPPKFHLDRCCGPDTPWPTLAAVEREARAAHVATVKL